MQSASGVQKRRENEERGLGLSQRSSVSKGDLTEGKEERGQDSADELLLLRLVMAVERVAEALERVEVVSHPTASVVPQPAPRPPPPPPAPPAPPPVQPSRVRANSAPRFPRVKNDTTKPPPTAASFDDVLVELRERIAARSQSN